MRESEYDGFDADEMFVLCIADVLRCGSNDMFMFRGEPVEFLWKD